MLFLHHFDDLTVNTLHSAEI